MLKLFAVYAIDPRVGDALVIQVASVIKGGPSLVINLWPMFAEKVRPESARLTQKGELVPASYRD